MSELLKMYKALENEELAQRVQGAMVKYAHYLSGLPNQESIESQFARIVLAEPFRKWLDMHLEVVANATVLEGITLDPNKTTAYGNYVKDSDISYVVETTWRRVASKYVSEPEA